MADRKQNEKKTRRTRTNRRNDERNKTGTENRREQTKENQNQTNKDPKFDRTCTKESPETLHIKNKGLKAPHKNKKKPKKAKNNNQTT